MIQPNEIRIGNWYHMENRGYFQWEYPHFDDYIKDKSSGWNVEGSVVSDKVEPIPLTAEILEQCGFKWETENKRHLQKEISSDKRMTFYFDNGEINSLQLYEDGYFDGFFSMDTVKYLHQLQNLYFALTGEELTVNFKDLTYQ